MVVFHLIVMVFNLPLLHHSSALVMVIFFLLFLLCGQNGLG